MSWIDLAALESSSGINTVRLCHIGPARLAAGAVRTEHIDELCAVERGAVGTSGEQRLRHFASGRFLARRAMTELGVNRAPVGRCESGRPQWPDGLVGSISHSGPVAAAVVAPAGRCGGVGIDLEHPARVTPHLHRRLFTDSERHRFGAADPRLPGLIFAAKEAGFKAVNPRTRRYIGFQEAEVEVDWVGGKWRLRYLGDHEPNRLMETGQGHFGCFGPYLVAVLLLPAIAQ